MCRENPKGGIVTVLTIGAEAFHLNVLTLADTPREQLDSEAMAIYGMFAQREREFGFGPDIVIEYPAIDDPRTSGFLTDPTGYIADRLPEIEQRGPIGRIVILTTYGQQLLGPLTAAGYLADQIDLPAGPDHTYAFTLDRAVPAAGRVLYLEAVNEADEKIRPTFVLKLLDRDGQLCGGACGSVHARDGQRYAYLATLTLIAGLPPGTGTALARAMIAELRRQGVVTVHLGTQTAGRFYEKLGFHVTHRLVSGLRMRDSAGGQHLRDDLVMLRMDL